MATSSLNDLLSITLIAKRDVPKTISELLVNGETANFAYSTLRDVAVFTDKRLIVLDTQGLTGTKKEYYSLPYRSIDMWSVETSGIVDLSGEIELWSKVGLFKIKLRKGIDVKEVNHIIAQAVLV